MPPAAIVSAATKFRNGLERAHRAAAPPFQLVLERALAIIDTKALACAVELRIPEHLVAGAQPVVDLAAACGADPDALRRLLRYLASRGIFRHESGDRFANNRASDTLREADPWSWRAWAELAGADWHGQIWDHLTDRVRHGIPATQAAFGVPFFDYVNRVNETAGTMFNAAMACGSRVQAVLFGEHVPLDRFRQLCDVGGGTGSVVAHLVRKYPHLRGLVFDLPELAAEARAVLDAAGVADRASFSGGDFFDSVPAGCDLYTMFAVVHDWSDERGGQILANVRAAMAPSGAVMVIEKPLPADGRPDFAKVSDLVMLVLGDGGRERTEPEYRRLFADAGFSVRRRTVLPSLFVVFELAPR